MTDFTIHTPETAPAGSQEQLSVIKGNWGFVPKLQGILAESPVALKAYDDTFSLIANEGTLSAVEIQVAYQAINVFHGCEYCTAGHTFLSRQAGVPEPVIAAIRNEQPIADERLQALRVFAEQVAEKRGFAGDSAVEQFLNAGFTKAQVLEVVAIIAAKVISNYTNHLTHTPLEDFMADPALRWEDPRGRTPARKEIAETA